MKKFIKSVSTVLVLIYFGMGIYLYLNQNNFLYFPRTETMHTHSNMNIQNEHESINIVVLNKGHQNAILYFGGNGESMAMSADYIAKQFPQFTCYLMDYRGYGKSSGQATEQGLYSDALKLYDTIKSKHHRVSIGGRSLGSGIATYVAANRTVSKLALITPYDSIVAVAQDKYPMYPASLLLHNNQYDSVSRVKDIKAKSFIVMAENDSVIPLKNTKNLIQVFQKDMLEVVTIQGRNHIDISSDEKYYKLMQDFIAEG